MGPTEYNNGHFTRVAASISGGPRWRFVEEKTTKKKYSEKGSRRFLRNVYTYGNCALLGHYAASSGNSLPTFSDNLSVPALRFKGTDTLPRNVCKEFPLLAA
jgi:hypothetical protein